MYDFVHSKFLSNFSLTLKLFCTIKCHKNFNICQLFTPHGKYFRQLKSTNTNIEVLVA